MNKGKIVQIIGPVVDVYFESGLPAIKNALTTRVDNREITLEVAQHVGLGRARARRLLQRPSNRRAPWRRCG